MSRTGDVTEIARGVHGQLTWVGDRLAAIRSGARDAHPDRGVRHRHDARGAARAGRRPRRRLGLVELPEPELVTVEHDGATLHARRYVAGAGRTLCWIHGGPTDQWQVEFLPRVAYWWSQGWDVLVPDPRGTTGHGRALPAGPARRMGPPRRRRHRRDPARRRTTRGWSVPERTVVMGGSSGGMTVLGVLGLHDGLAAAGVALYPVTDLADSRRAAIASRRTTPCRSSVRSTTSRLYRERSPLTFADRIAVPLLVLHGDADPVVPIEQSVRLVERIRSSGEPADQRRVEFHVMEGEGHGFRAVENKLAEYRLIGDFVSRWR